jgi:hypothetical protein
MTEAVDLQANTVFPSDTFRFRAPRGTFVAHGDVEPHVFGLRPVRTPEYDGQPVRMARYEMASRGGRVPFRPLAPGYLPPRYALIRVRAARDRWLDAYWVNNDSGSIVKLVEQAASSGPPTETAGGSRVAIPTSEGDCAGRLVVSDVPYPHHYLSWERDGVVALLSTSELPLAETVRIAGSAEPVDKQPSPAAPRPVVAEANPPKEP